MKELERLPFPLLEWFRENARTLPWRSEPTPYHVWVSEIMLQQTRVAAVLGYYRRFIERLPTVEDLAACSEEELMKLWQGLGYYSRARNLQKAARTIVAEYGGEFPQTYSQIRELAGVGDYTAGAISSIAFGIPVPAVDGNVLRVVSRITGDRRDVTKPDTKRAFTEALEEIMPVREAGNFNQALMELGAVVCLPNGAPLCEKCPAADFCRARRENTVSELPVKPPKKERRVEERAVYLIFRGDRVALRKRPSKGLLAGLWEYPNALEGAECPAAGEVSYAAAGKHIFTHIEWRMKAYTVQAEGEELPSGWVWASREELARIYAIPNAFGDFSSLVDKKLTEASRI